MKNRNFFPAFFLHFWNLHEVCNVVKKNEPHRSYTSEVVDSKTSACLNA